MCIRDSPRRDVRRPLEHQVLEEMGKSGAAGHFVAGTDLDPQVDRHRRDRPVRRHDDPQPIGQGPFGDRVVDIGHAQTLQVSARCQRKAGAGPEYAASAARIGSDNAQAAPTEGSMRTTVVTASAATGAPVL